MGNSGSGGETLPGCEYAGKGARKGEHPAQGLLGASHAKHLGMHTRGGSISLDYTRSPPHAQSLNCEALDNGEAKCQQQQVEHVLSAIR